MFKLNCYFYKKRDSNIFLFFAYNSNVIVFLRFFIEFFKMC